MWHAWERRVYMVLVGKPEGKRQLGRPRRRSENGIRMNLEEICWGRGWIGFDWRRAVVYAVMNLWVLAPWS
jgi:hypothetical protein